MARPGPPTSSGTPSGRANVGAALTRTAAIGPRTPGRAAELAAGARRVDAAGVHAGGDRAT